MEVKINREIRNYTESMFFGLSLRQFVFSLLAVGVAVLLYFVLKPYVGCCFSERMRKLFRKNEKNVLRFCNKKAKEKRRLQRVKKPM